MSRPQLTPSDKKHFAECCICSLLLANLLPLLTASDKKLLYYGRMADIELPSKTNPPNSSLLSGYIFASMLPLCYLLWPGPSGNQPLSTRRFWWISSNMLQNDEKAVTPRIVDAIRFSTISDNAQNAMPATRNIHQHLVPR